MWRTGTTDRLLLSAVVMMQLSKSTAVGPNWAASSMIKAIKFEPHAIAPIPVPLQQATTGAPLDEIDVDIDQLCHQLFQDCHGAVPAVNPAVAYLLALLSGSPSFEFAGAGPATHKEARVGESNKYGKAFCRWLLYTHFGQTYFAHVDVILKSGLPVPLNAWTFKKIKGALAPDYVCANNTSVVILGEAKGRQIAITWHATTGPFKAWREQFDALEITNPAGTKVKLKGYVVAAIMRNQSHKSLQSILIAEDPENPGERAANAAEGADLRRAVMAHHYSDVLERLAHPVHAAFLRSGLPLAIETGRQVFLWNCLIPSLRGRTSVGGYFPPEDVLRFEHFPCVRLSDRGIIYDPRMNLKYPRCTFYGLDKDVFGNVLSAVRRGTEALAAVEQQEVPPTPEGVSFLRDGTLICSLDYMQPVDTFGI